MRTAIVGCLGHVGCVPLRTAVRRGLFLWLIAWGVLGCASRHATPEDTSRAEQALGGGILQLASSQSGPTGIAVDATSVYFTDQTGGTVMKVPLGGGSTTTLASGQSTPSGIAVDATSVYWANSGGGTVVSLPLAGGTVTTLASAQGTPLGIAVDHTNVYWTNTGGTVASVPLAGGTVVTLASGQTTPSGIAVDGASVYWTNSGSGTVMKVPLAGGTATTLASGQSTPSGIAVDGASVYWTNSSGGTVMKVPLAGGTATTLASGQSTPSGIALDGLNIYWANSGNGTLMRMPLAGGNPVAIASGQGNAASVAANGSSLFWTNASGGTVQQEAVLRVKGADALVGVVNAVLAACPGAGAINDVGGGSAAGESAMTSGSQTIAPMTDFLGTSSCTDGGARAEGLVVGLDGIRIVAAQTTAGTAACNGAAADCDPTTDPTAGVAWNTTVTRPTKGAYTFNGWRDVLRILYGGVSNDTNDTGCNSEIRAYVASHWSSFFESACTSGACTQIQHAFRPDDGSGTAVVFASLLGLSPSPSASAANGFGASPYCNAMNWDTATGTCLSTLKCSLRGTPCTTVGAPCSPNANCALNSGMQFIGPGGVAQGACTTNGVCSDGTFCDASHACGNGTTCQQHAPCWLGYTGGVCGGGTSTLIGAKCATPDGTTVCDPANPATVCQPQCGVIQGTTTPDTCVDIETARGTGDPLGTHRRPPLGAWGDNPDPNGGAGNPVVGTATRSADAYPTSYQDNDPIRRSCVGTSTNNALRAGEEVCNIDGTLGLVLPIPPTEFLLSVRAPISGLQPYPTNPWSNTGKLGLAANVHNCAVRSGQVRGGSRHGAQCPNGDQETLGKCPVPTDDSSTLTANGSSLCVTSSATVAAKHRAIGNPDGRVYNLHIRDGTAASGTIGYAIQTIPTTAPNATGIICADGSACPSPGTVGTACLDGSQCAVRLSLDFTGAFGRIHEVQSIPANLGGCKLANAADQIGCLVHADTCSIGVSGGNTSTQAGAVALKVNALDPTASCIQSTTYPLWRKVYLSTQVGFPQVNGAELALSQCTASATTMNPLLSASGFVPLPASGSNALNGGAPYCEDFDEQVVCGASSNANACSGNGAVALPTVSTTCGNGVVEALEECDKGSSNGLPPAVCSSICRANPGGQPPQWPSSSSVTVTASGPTAVQVSWTAATDPNGVTGYSVYQGGTLVATVSGSTLSTTVTGLTPGSPYTYTVQANDGAGLNSTNGPSALVCTPVDMCHQAGTYNPAAVRCTPGPPVAIIDDGNACTLDTCDPVNGIVHHACTPVDRTVATPLANAAAFVFSGSTPVQTGVDAGTVAPATMALLRGKVLDAAGVPLVGVTVTVAGHPELGSTVTQGSGMFDMAVNGGQPVRLQFALNGYLPAERVVQAPWQDYAKSEDVTLVQADYAKTAINLSNTTDIQVHRGTAMTDDAGTRTATLMVPPSTQATAMLPDGGTIALNTITVRATEYTVGDAGPSAMPAALPPTSAYTYAFELTADEALDAGATTVAFTQPDGGAATLPYYVENFLGFDAGVGVPVGYYDKTKGAWVPSASGVVITILSESGTPPQATIDVTGSGTAATTVQLTALGITNLELQHLASLYPVGRSLWRVPVAHFTTYDPNWGFSAPADAGPPPPPPPPPPKPGPGDCKDQSGSVIECQRQALGQTLPIAGTSYSLHYTSDHQQGRQSSVDVPLSGPSLPGPVKRIDMEVDIAGRVIRQSFPPQPNQTTTFMWDGNDVYGRMLQGGQLATILVGNTYDGAYGQPSQNMFGYYGGGVRVTGNKARKEVAVQTVWNTILGGWDDRPGGVGGWSVSVHHAFDIGARTIRFGDGSELTPASMPGVIQTIVGNGTKPVVPQDLGDGGPATSALTSPESVAVGPDGSLYISEEFSCVRRIGTDGTIRTFAGRCFSNGFSGDEGPATSAQLGFQQDISFGPDGSLYIADFNNHRIRRVGPDGIIHSVAGSGTAGFSDNMPATQAMLNQPTGVDVASDGTLYICDSSNNRIRRVGPDGIITTIAGSSSNFKGNDGPATAAGLGTPVRVRVGNDGSFYISEPFWPLIRRVGTDGIIRVFAGGGSGRGDGGPAASAQVFGPGDMALGPDGSLFFADGDETLRHIDTGGIISTVAGQHGNATFSGDNGPAAAATYSSGHRGIRVAPDGTLYLGVPGDARLRRIQPPLPTFNFGTSSYQFASLDGKQVYTFDTSGRHLKTVDAFTGATLYQFNYDSGGRLFQIVDVDNNITTINRDVNGDPQNITPPFAGATTFMVDPNTHYLTTIADPAHQQWQFTYSQQGLMISMVDARNGMHTFQYDALGRLQFDQDPAGGSKTLTPSVLTGGFSVDVTSALGRKTTYQTTVSTTGTFARQNTFPDGTQSSLQFTTAGTTTVTAADGTITTTTQAPDPRFGMLSPMLSTTTTTPSGLTSKQTTTRSFTTSSGNLATWTEVTKDFNNNPWTKGFTASSRTWTTTSPVGRTSTMITDAAGRPTQISVPGVTAYTMTYDPQGRLKTTSQGSRTWTMGYDTTGFLSSVTDPLTHAMMYQNDAVGRPRQTTLPDGRIVLTVYDGDNNPTSVTLPSPSNYVHGLAYTPVDLLSSYTPPSLDTGSWLTQYGYNVDRQLTSVTRPDGNSNSITYAYDATTGRLTGTTYAQGTLTPTYDPQGRVTTLASPSGETLTYSYDGFLRSGTTWSGPVAGSISFGRDANFFVTTQTLNGTALMFVPDNDVLLKQAGALIVNRDSGNGRITDTALGSVTDVYGYDPDGRLSSYTAKFSGSAIYSESLMYYADNRIQQKTEVIGSESHVWGYMYDPAGRLTDVTKDGPNVAHYGYDQDDNRMTFTNSGGTVSPTYDPQDRLTAYGSTTYTYTRNGDLSSKTVGAPPATNYTYDAFGNLLHVGLPSGTNIDYLVDGENRRVGKKVNTTLTQGFLYQDALNVVAQLDGTGALVARFVFGTKPNVPDYYTTSAGTFRILSDHLGSPRLIVNTSSGATVERIDYDEFGNITQDTSPGLIPFGFAGGLYDKDTGLVRFGARDYDASVGRWTSKDPIRFKGGSFNLYGYGLSDPVNNMDPSGLANGSPGQAPFSPLPTDPCNYPPGDNLDDCLKSASNPHDWALYCSQLPSPVDRARCFRHYFSSPVERQNWCYFRYGT
jgi:RHS repeat-associated protein